jgi:hypothetical protein
MISVWISVPPTQSEVTVRVDRADGHSLPDRAAFAVAASRAASSVNASVVSAHTAEEITCVVGKEITVVAHRSSAFLPVASIGEGSPRG